MPSSRSLRCAAALVLLLGAACATSSQPPPGAPDVPEGRAALATVNVENATPHELTVEFRPAGSARGRVGIGTVPARSTRRLAPVPAGEPIVLTARTGQGGALELPARTFGVDEVWVWQIPADAVFR